MFRKLMAGIVLSSVPVLSFGVAQIATTGQASAAGTTTCTGTTGAPSQTVTFASPGISEQGTASASAKSVATTSSGSITCTGAVKGNGTVASSKTKVKSTLTCASDSNPPSPCPTGDFVYDTAGQLAGGASTLYKGVKTTDFTVGKHSYIADNTGSASAGSGSGPGLCPSGESGFVLTGHLSTSTKASTEITVCLDTDAGPNTTGNLVADVTSELEGNTSILITSSTLDPTASSIVFS